MAKVKPKIKPAKMSWASDSDYMTGISGKYTALVYRDIGGKFNAKVGVGSNWSSYLKSDTLAGAQQAAEFEVGKKMFAAAARKKKASGRKMTPDQLRKRKISTLRNQVRGNQIARTMGFSPANPGAERRLRALEMGLDE